jgi:Holliday junction resolvasome RuvABC ATP-dependent DNA helicase subunit
MVPPRGTGKTLLATVLAKNLKGSNGEIKPTLSINCASIKNLGQFVDQLIIPFHNTELTYFFDECHLFPKDVSNWLLSVISPNKEKKSFNYHNNIRYDFDYTQTSFIGCTTNPEKLSEAFKSRLERVDLDDYSDYDLIKILYRNAPDIEFKDTELDIVSVCRGTPREVVKLSDRIKQFCEVKKSNIFEKKDWEYLRKKCGINYLGLNNHEVKHLLSLKEHGELTITMLAAKLRLDRTTIQRDIERFLMEKSLIFVNQNSKRILSKQGCEAIKQLTA